MKNSLPTTKVNMQSTDILIIMFKMFKRVVESLNNQILVNIQESIQAKLIQHKVMYKSGIIRIFNI
jgi:hypothetical protein